VILSDFDARGIQSGKAERIKFRPALVTVIATFQSVPESIADHGEKVRGTVL